MFNYSKRHDLHHRWVTGARQHDYHSILKLRPMLHAHIRTVVLQAEIRVRDLVSAEEALKLQLSAERQRHSSSSRSSSGGGWLACFRPSEGGGF